MSPEVRVEIEALALQRRQLISQLAERPSGLAWCEAHTHLVDDVVKVLVRGLPQEEIPAYAVIATGGYGRRELAPFSDIDLTVVPEDESSAALDTTLRQFFQDLHTAFSTMMRMDVGYAYRLIADAPSLDAKTRTGLIDMRLISGSDELFRRLDAALEESFAPGEFIRSKINERNEMFAKYHRTPLVVEPQLKEGAGGLRCFHCANWLREALGERPARPTQAYEHLIRTRNLLHLVSQKPQDQLSRHRQAEIADVLGQDMYSMMSDVVAAGSEVHADYRRATERLHTARFRLAKSVWADQGEVRLEGNINPGDAAVGVAIATHLGLRVSDIRVSLTGEVNGPAAAYALSEGVPTILNLDRCGLLGQILPELDECRTLMPTDPVHQYTVFEHTLRVVKYLDSLESGTFLGDVRDSVNDSQPLYLAALLHDVGKIDPARSHSEAGAELARDICTRWNLAPGVTDTVEWLVRDHLTMSRFIRIRDLMNPATIVEFAQIVGTTDRLGLLTLLTWADVSAVAEGSWTNAQDTFIRQLFELTTAHLSGEIGLVHEPAQYRRRLMKQLARQSLDEAAVQRFVESLPSYYLTSTPPDLVRLHMLFAEKAMAGESTVEIHHRADLSATELTVCTLDAPAILSKLLAVIYAYDLSVTGIRACTTMTAMPVALDTITVSFAGKPVPPSTSSQVSLAIKDVLENRRDADEILRAKGKDPERDQQIFTHNYVEASPAILEIRAPRGRGMPYRFSRRIAQQGWNIVSARVGQWAGNATGAFYLQNADGTVPSREEVALALSS